MTSQTFSKSLTINDTMTVKDIVLNDFHTADVFYKNNIEFCCGGKWPLEMACKAKNLDITAVIKELKIATCQVQVSNDLNFHNWSTGFLIDFIINVHHEYLRHNLPIALAYVSRFMEGHLKNFPWLKSMEDILIRLENELLPHLQEEEESLFPYIKQVSTAYHQKLPYAKLLVKTLRKPLVATLQKEHELLRCILHQMRELTSDFSTPENACITHKVSIFKLKELYNDLTLHLYLENEILFPRAIAIENELLG